MMSARVSAETVRRFWAMLAHLQAQVVDKSSSASGLGVSSPRVTRYMDLLIDLLGVRALPPWSGDIGKRFAKRPRYLMGDSGLAHALLSIQSLEGLREHPVVERVGNPLS